MMARLGVMESQHRTKFEAMIIRRQRAAAKLGISLEFERLCFEAAEMILKDQAGDIDAPVDLSDLAEPAMSYPQYVSPTCDL